MNSKPGSKFANMMAIECCNYKECGFSAMQGLFFSDMLGIQKHFLPFIIKLPRVLGSVLVNSHWKWQGLALKTHRLDPLQ